ncbi:MAG: glycosyltransferase family 2 protein [Brumimicrobium sp.]|nr:glycosyltransferase family 2 protein [Brumimicrobium sp.]
MSESRTAIVILNWNGKSYLEQFLPKLIEYSPGHEVIVADNCSTDDSVPFLRRQFPDTRLITNEINGGFARGYNDALKVIQGEFDYYVLINSDVEVTENWLDPLLIFMRERKGAAGVQPKVRAFHNKDYFEHAGASGGFIDKNYYPFCRGRIFDHLERDEGQYDQAKEIFWTTGACMLIKANVFHELNGFDEDFFAHMEEIDLCWRAKKKNHSFYVEPKSLVYHVGGGTLNYENPGKTFLNFRNNLFMIHKNHRGNLFFKMTKRLFLDGLAAFKYLIGFKFKHFGAVFRAHMAYYRKLGTLNTKRKMIRKSSTEFNDIGLYRGSIIWAYYFKRIKSFGALNKRLFQRN